MISGRRIGPQYPDQIGILNAQYQTMPRGGLSAPPMTATTTMPPENSGSPVGLLASAGGLAYKGGVFDDLSGKGAFYDSVMKDLAPGGMDAATIAQEAALDSQFGTSLATEAAFGGQSAAVPAIEGLGAAAPIEMPMLAPAGLDAAGAAAYTAEFGGIAPAVEFASAAPAVEAGLAAGAAEGAAATAAAEGGLLAGAGALGPLAIGALGIYGVGKLFDWW